MQGSKLPSSEGETSASFESVEKLAVARPRRRELSGPEIRLSYTPAGRATLAALADELGNGTNLDADLDAAEPQSSLVTEPSDAEPELVRPRFTTKGYSDPPDAAFEPALASRAASAPEISISHSPAGRETLAAINEELTDRLGSEPPTGVRATLSAQQADAETSVEPAPEIHELLSFIVRGGDLERMSVDERRAFALRHLRHRLPIQSEADIERIDVTPWTAPGRFVLRVHCRIAPND